MPITIEEAVKLVLEHTAVLPEEQIPLRSALGRTLSSDVYACIDQPPFDRSPLDGYAVCAVDTLTASPEHPVTLQVVDKIHAGQLPHAALRPGQAVRLMTGAMLPEGADGVIRQEDTDLGEDRVRIFRGVPSGANCCRRGEEYTSGEVLLSAGTVVDAAAVAVAAGAGLDCLPAHRHARAAIISIGDEVCQPGHRLPRGKIYDSNTAYLAARLEQLGAKLTQTLAEDDVLENITAALERCSECDVILTTGGASVGQKDLLEEAVKAFGAQVIFHGVAIKPGMPVLFAHREHIALLGLSGNPFSAAVSFELLFRPLLAKMTQDHSLKMQRLKGIAANDFLKPSPTRRFLRARVEGNAVVMPVSQANGQMRSMVGCNCLVDVPAGSRAVRKGDAVDILLL